MKNIFFAVVCAFIWFGGFEACATPMLYTFEGHITVTNDRAGIIADSGIMVGDEVSYVFLIDFDRTGTYTRNSGEVFLADWDSTFFVEYLYGTRIFEKDGGIYGAPNEILKYNYGFDRHKNIYTGSTNSNVYLELYNFQDFAIGSTGRVSNTAWDSTGNYSQLDAQDLVLTNISSPIPEPSTIFLLGIGLVGGVASISRKR